MSLPNDPSNPLPASSNAATTQQVNVEPVSTSASKPISKTASTSGTSADRRTDSMDKKPGQPIRRCLRWKAYLLCGFLLVAFVASATYGALRIKQQLTYERDRIEKLVQDNAQHWNTAQTQGQQTLEKLQKLDEQFIDLRVQVEQVQTQQKALDTFYQTFTRDRERLTLLEIRRVLETANGQLGLTGNVSLARFALQGALARLTGLHSAKVQAVRMALTQDLAVLEALPVVDIPSMMALLDMAYGQIDTLPLAGEVRLTALQNQASQKTAPVSSTAPASDEPKHFSLKRIWDGLWGGFMQQLHTLVQVRRIDDADAMRVSPQEDYFLRENLKLRVLSARLAVLARHDAVLLGDLQAIDVALNRYFDEASVKVQMVRNALEKVRHMPKNNALPSLKASLEAIGP